MTIQDLGSIGELVAALATVATLFYLAIQIRQNTKQLKFNNSAVLWDGMNRAFDPVYAGENLRIFQSAMAGESLSADEMMAFRFICFRVFSHFYQLHTHSSAGQLTVSEIEMHRAVMVTMLTAPGIRNWWDEIGKNTFPLILSRRLQRTSPRPIDLKLGRRYGRSSRRRRKQFAGAA